MYLYTYPNVHWRPLLQVKDNKHVYNKKLIKAKAISEQVLIMVI